MRCLFMFMLALLAVDVQAQTVVSYADTVEKLLPSVVSVSATKVSGETPEMVQALRGSPFEQFFNEYYRDGSFDAPKSILLGSGFVYDAKGHILTSAHVVESLDEVKITLNDGRVVNAKVVGRDSKTDLALLKTNESLKPVKVGNSDKMRVGDPVLAIGNAFGLGNTVTSGIVSARSRDIQVGPYDDFIQTDAAINRGNSGGPLFNATGELIGVNTAIFSPSGGSVGIAFAVPSKQVRVIANALIKDGVVKRGRLGLKVQSVSAEMAKKLKMPQPTGALVSEVDDVKDSKIKKGDVILSYNGQPVTAIRQLPRMAAMSTVGATVPLEIWRNGQKLTVPVVLSLLQEPVQKKPASVNVDEAMPIALLGIMVAELTPEIRAKNNISKSTTGMLVTAVDPNSEAASKGLKVGDVLVELDKKPIKTPDSVGVWAAEAAEMGMDSAFLLIDRQGERFFSVVKFAMAEE